MSNQRIVRGVRQSIPSGYVVGRAARGKGAAGLISLQDIGQQLVSSGAVSPGGAPGTTGTTYTAGTGLTLTSTTFSLTNPVAVNLGGTGLAAGTSGGIPAYTGSTTITSSGVLAANKIVVGGGAAAVPATEADWSFSSHILLGNLNSGTPAASPTDTLIHLAGADGHAVRLVLDAYANGASSRGNILYRFAEGTAASPAAVGMSDNLGRTSWIGYTGAAYSSDSTFSASYFVLATENWTSTATGTEIRYAVTPTGTVTNVTAASYTGQGSAILGTTTNDSASAGYNGEYISTNKLVANEVSLSNATTTDVMTITLSAGDWDVEGAVAFDFGAATVTKLSCAVSATSATLPTAGSQTGIARLIVATVTLTDAAGIELPTGTVRMSVTGTPTIYLVARPTFSAGTLAGYGFLRARRVR